MQKRIWINNQIKAKEVRLIDSEGKMLGVFTLQEALVKAHEADLDLIEISEKTVPPICKIADYGKFSYQQGKKEKKMAKGQRAGEVKGVRLSFAISPHDMEIRAKAIEKFLKSGYKVRVEMTLRGRQKGLADFAKNKMLGFLEMLKATTPIKVERELKMEARGWVIIIAKAMYENKEGISQKI
ncbi:MAG: translation initiation factor IF-3 [Candidatus Pacebacteria bacterium]|nr:translation initiation factor IF-3 [Candidatus Paceibacterota bacterium]